MMGQERAVDDARCPRDQLLLDDVNEDGEGRIVHGPAGGAVIGLPGYRQPHVIEDRLLDAVLAEVGNAKGLRQTQAEGRLARRRTSMQEDQQWLRGIDLHHGCMGTTYILPHVSEEVKM